VGPTRAGPSFELFYEKDHLMPHREAAWALLGERIREAASFCGVAREDASEYVARALAPVEQALAGVADPLAAHFSDWGATSRFAATGQGHDAGAGDAAEPPATGTPVDFEQDIKPLFRERDRYSMRFAFVLWSLTDVTAHADAILRRVEEDTMPCDGAWPADRVTLFRRWVESR
jgi:hypothetical protein